MQRTSGKTSVGASWAELNRSVYERHAAGFDRNREHTLIERAWLDRCLACVPAGGSVLDLGCGAGEPIARYLIEQGYQVTGVDFAEPMLGIARARFPQARWIHADMRELDLGERFAGIVAWDSFFHLTEDEQRAAIPRLARHLGRGGAMLLTVGPEEGAVTGTVEGEIVYHASLSRDEYEALLDAAGLTLAAYAAEDPACDYHSVLLASG